MAERVVEEIRLQILSQMDDLSQIAELLKQRNAIDAQISAIIGRPATSGHLGEFIAAKIFAIALMPSATATGLDGHFTNGRLAGRSVNIKFYGKREGILDVPTTILPDFFLVLTGPKSAAMSSRGRNRPFVIDAVYLFDAHALVTRLECRLVKVGIAASVRQEFWNEAEIYPTQRNKLLRLSNEQRNSLAIFGSDSD